MKFSSIGRVLLGSTVSCWLGFFMFYWAGKPFSVRLVDQPCFFNQSQTTVETVEKAFAHAYLCRKAIRSSENQMDGVG